jgi:TonB family protein
MTDYTHDIKQYLSGAMTPQERHAFEKKVLADPFLAEALEGAEQLSAAEFREDVEALNKQILEVEHEVAAASASKKAAATPAFKRAKVHKIESSRVTAFSWTVRLAAGLVIVLVSAYLIWQVAQPAEKQEALAMEESASPPPPASLPDTSLYKDEAGEPVVAETIVDAKPEKTDRAGVKSSSPYQKPETAKDDQEVREEARPTEQPAVTEPLIAETKPVEIAPTLDVKADEIVREKLAVEKEEKAKLAEAIQRETNDAAKKQAAGRAMAAPITGLKVIRGKVTSADDGSPLPGINVIVKGTSIGTATGVDGRYQIATDVTNPVLVYTFIGMQTTEVDVGTRSEIDVSLAQDVTQLSEVVVTGYGAQRSDEPYTPTVELAHPENGSRAFRQYLEKNIAYPEEAKIQKIEGRVTVDFFVEPDGSLSGFTVIRGIGGGCDEELIRLIQNGPKWIPTKRDNAPVRDKVRVRLKFELPK